MQSYIWSECYRTFHRKYLYVFAGVCVVGILGIMFLMFSGNQYTPTVENRLHTDTMMFALSYFLPSVALYALLLTGDISFSDEYKNLTLRNTVSFGIPRATIYFGKLISAIFYSVLLLAAITVTYIGSSMLLLGVGNWDNFRESMQLYFTTIAAAFPLWVAGLSLANLLLFVLQSNTAVAFSFIGVFMLTGTILDALGSLWHPVFAQLKPFLISSRLDQIAHRAVSGGDMATYWITGLAFTAVFCLIGVFAFQRKEIK